MDFDLGGGLIYVPADAIKAYAPEVPLYAEKTFVLPPGQELRTLTGLKHHHQTKIVRVELMPSGEKAVMYWNDIYHNTVVTTAGEPLPAKATPVRHKFPNKCQRNLDLVPAGETAWGRPLAKVGQTVWSANHSRAMGRGSVGVLIEVDRENAIVKTLAGTTHVAWHRDCVPLTDEEIAWFPTP